MFIYGGGWFNGDKTDGQESAWVMLREQGDAIISVFVNQPGLCYNMASGETSQQ